MRCAHCAEIIRTAPISGICCSAQCARRFAETLEPVSEQDELLPIAAEQFADFCAMFGVAVEIDDSGRILF